MKDAVLLLLCAVALAQGINQGPEQRSRPCNCDPFAAQEICQANYDNDDVLIAHEYCDKFYKCANGKPVAYNCPNQLLYDPFTETCEWPYNVECGNRPISEGPGKDEDSDSGSDDVTDIDNDWTCNCNPGEAPSICAAEGSNGILVAHQNCNQFYKCAEGRPVTFDCVPALLYNPFKEVCDWPKNVDCGDRVIPVPDDSANTPGGTDPAITTPESTIPGNNCNPSEAPAICAADYSEGVLVAHQNCNQFYVCSGGKPVTLTCPPNLLFNPAKDQCDWPFNVDCGDRVIPDPDDSPTTPGGTNPGETNPAVTTPGSTIPGNNCDPSEAPAICAANDSEGVLVAHQNCNQFYVCSGGKPAALTCPPNLLFNPAKDQCDWPFNVDCGDRVIPDPESSDSGNSEIHPPGDGVMIPPQPSGTCNCNPKEASSICAAENSSGVLVAHENCNQLYKCDHGKPVVLNCYGDLLYNPYTEQCDWPENVDCGDRVISDPDDSATTPGGTNPEVSTPGSTIPGNNCDPSEAPAICAANDSEGVLVAHQNCNQFYVCSGGKPAALTCPPNLLFNPAKDQCDWPFNVDCGDRVIPDPESSDSGNSEIHPPGDGVMIPPQPSGTCNCNPEEASSICAAEDSNGVIVAHENCNQFYKCDHGKPVVLNCYGDLLYNPYTEQCDWPENVDCGDRVISDPDDSATTPGGTNPEVSTPGSTIPGNNSDPSEAPAICAANDSEGVLVAHQNCNQFYVCSGGKPAALTCPPNLLFNPAKDQCDWPFNVDCGDRVIPDPDDSPTTPGGTNPAVTTPRSTIPGNNCDPSEAPAICAANDSEGVLVAHQNCNQFYVCSGGKPAALTCPPNLLFNPAKDQCDWPFNVDCGDRVIPDPDDSSTTPGGTNPGETNPAVTTPGSTIPGNNCDPSEAPAICAANDSEGVLVAHQNCNQFYVCSGGKPAALTCPPNLLFNPAKDQCDWPFNVDCGDRVIPDPESSDSGNSEIHPPGDGVMIPPQPSGTCNCNPKEASSICAAEDSSGVLVAHENCNQLYKCDHGKPVVLNCYGDLLYNPYTEQCDWPENVDCGDRVISDPDDSATTPGGTNPEVSTPGSTIPGNNCDPSEAPAICAANDSEGVLVAHQNCNQFYVCSGGKPAALTCPPNLLFNPAKDQCDWPFNVDCGDRVIPDPESPDSGNSEIHPPGDGVMIPPQPSGTCNCNPEEAPSICAAEDSNSVLVAHENCNQFYKCGHGKPVVLNCYGDLLYNPYTEQCDWPENVDCGDRVISDPDDSATTPGGTNPEVSTPGSTIPGNNCDPSEAPAICAANDSEGILVAHQNCNQFYVCSGGKPAALTCPPNLLFNPAKDQCDWPFNVDCGDRVIPDPESSDSGSSEIRPPGDGEPTRPPGTCNCNPEEASSICAAEDSNGVLVAHENCNQFYKCDHGKPVVLNCYGDLLYNPYTEQCDWPENVDCGNRVFKI